MMWGMMKFAARDKFLQLYIVQEGEPRPEEVRELGHARIL